jgi:hypothetical protein
MIEKPSGRGRTGKRSHIRAYCSQCRHEYLFIKARHHHLLHLIATICTLGLWLIPWAAICVGQMMRPWRCEHCGWHKPVFRNPDAIKRDTIRVPRATIRWQRDASSS